MQHNNAKLTPTGRKELVKLVEDEGLSLHVAAATCNVAPSTAHKWVWRWRDACQADRRSLECLGDRPSRPRKCPWELSRDAERRICEVRTHTGWGPRLVAGVVGHPHSTVWKVLRRNGISRPPKPVKEPVIRYEWPCPGDLLHVDIKSYARFRRPGHAVTGDRAKTGHPPVGYDYAHVAVDDHTRLTYVELLSDYSAETTTDFMARAFGFFASHDIAVKRLMTDNAWNYSKNISLQGLVGVMDIKHIFTKPYRPQTNGKVERFHQTMAREWGYGLTYKSSEARKKALPYWVNYYNHQRPHSSTEDRPPISRVRNVCG